MIVSIVARKETALDALSRTKMDIYLPRESSYRLRQKELQSRRIEAIEHVIKTGTIYRNA